jgi:hypothetical protein
MKLMCKALVVLLLATGAWADNKDKDQFQAGPVTEYPSRQTIGKVTIAAQPFETDAQTREAFGKKNPNQHGVLPVLVVIQNDSDQAINLEQLEVEYVAGRENIEATPARDVPYLVGPNSPKMTPGPIPTTGPRIPRKKNALNTWHIEGRAFAARMIPPGEKASGFFYFQTPHTLDATMVLRGMREAASGKELFFFEIPLETGKR